ncbi:MAG: PQQ-binding-like beta-propeller repeat protein [Pseudomonadota bacterium]
MDRVLTICFCWLLTDAAVAEFHNAMHAPGYMDTTWATVHGDSSNSDYVPLQSSIELEFQWRILEGAGIWTAPSVARDGTLYSTTGRGRGYSSLHAINPDGSIRWQSKPYRNEDDLDSLAVFSCPVLDERGDIYVGDSNQFWAFRPDGSIKWVVDLRELGIQGAFVTAAIVGEHVGGVSTDGKVVLFRRDSGEPSAPVLDLPGGSAKVDSPKPPGLWDGGLMDPERVEMVWDVLLGNIYEIANSPAVNPKTGRLYITGAGTTEEAGHLYGIDLKDGKLTIGMLADIPPNSGTSPAISPDGKRLYAMAQGDVFAMDADSGKTLWSRPVDGQAASPSVSIQDVVYVLAGDDLVAVQGETGEIVWSRAYHAFAEQHLPKLWRRFGLFKTGAPVAYIDSVVTITENVLWTSLLLSYDLNLFGREHATAVQTHLVALNPEDGAVLASYPLPDSSEGGISVGPQGELYLDILAAQASVAWHGGYRWLLPREATPAELPRGGLVAFRPKH